jgi:hypothetical protein
LLFPNFSNSLIFIIIHPFIHIFEIQSNVGFLELIYFILSKLNKLTLLIEYFKKIGEIEYEKLKGKKKKEVKRMIKWWF